MTPNISLMAACKIIANRNGGVLETRSAVRELTEAGMFECLEDARHALFNALTRTSFFIRRSPGLYNLVPDAQAWVEKYAKE